MEAWKEYEEKFFNNEIDWNGELNVKKYEGPCEEIFTEVYGSINSLKSWKNCRTEWCNI